MSSQDDGGGAHFEEVDRLDIRDTLFKGNGGRHMHNTGMGGGVSLLHVLDALITDSVFSHNARDYGGGLGLKLSMARVLRSNFTFNWARYGGAVNTIDQSTLMMKRSILACVVADESLVGPVHLQGTFPREHLLAVG